MNHANISPAALYLPLIMEYTILLLNSIETNEVDKDESVDDNEEGLESLMSDEVETPIFMCNHNITKNGIKSMKTYIQNFLEHLTEKQKRIIISCMLLCPLTKI